MQAGLTANIAAADVDPWAQQNTPVAAHKVRRRTLIFGFTAAIAYLIGMIAMIPAAAVVDETDRLSVGGTIWDGEAVLDSTIRVAWDFSLISSLTKLAYNARWHLTGSGNDLAGSATQRGEQLQLDDVSGQADGVLLDVLFPNLPLSCRFAADVRLAYLHLGGSGQGGAGSLRTGPVNCNAKDLAAFPLDLPQMQADLAPAGVGTAGALKTAENNAHLIELRLSPDGMLSVWPTQMAVEMAPMLAGKRYDTKIE